MGLFDIFKRKDKRNNHSFSDDDRKYSADLRKLNAERKKILQEIELEKAKFELDQLRDELYNDDEEEQATISQSPEQMIMQMFIMNMMKNQQQAQTPVQTINKDLTDDEIKNLVSLVPDKHLKKHKNYNDEQINAFVKSQMPNLNDNNIKQIINHIRTNY
jgi:hypothetical protein